MQAINHIQHHGRANSMIMFSFSTLAMAALAISTATVHSAIPFAVGQPLATTPAAPPPAIAPPAVTPGKVLPSWPATYDMAQSTAIMICNNSGPVGAAWAARWGLVDIDWNSDKRDWSAASPMNAEENMLANANAIKAVDPTTIAWVYRNGIKAL